MIYRRFLKRAVDLLGATLILVIASPLLAIVAAAIRLEDRGPALFRQRRVGAGGKEFLIFKFRSMPVATPQLPSAAARELRLTRVGRVIRRTNIDELPQLFNVIRGDMSLVGPRPALPQQVDLLTVRRANGAHLCKPGLTGLAQIKAYDGMPETEKGELDGRYAAKLSLPHDFAILLRTFGYLMRPPPTY